MHRNGKHLAAELQFIHRATRETSTNESHENDQKFPPTLILSVLFEVQPEPNYSLQSLISIVNSSALESRFSMNFYKLLPKYASENYYQYMGSLTHPPCTENVIWIILKFPSKIGRSQMKILRKLDEKFPALKENYRPIQYIGDRVVYDSYTGHDFGVRNWRTFGDFRLRPSSCAAAKFAYILHLCLLMILLMN